MKKILTETYIRNNEYRIIYYEFKDIKYLSIEIKCHFLIFNWWMEVTRFNIDNDNDFDFQFNEATKLLYIIKDIYTCPYGEF